MLKEKWIWDRSKKKMIKVMAISKCGEPITMYIKPKDSMGGKIDGSVYEDIDEDVLAGITYEIDCPQCKSLTKIVGSMDRDVFEMKEPCFKCPDCHLEMPLVVKKY